MNLTSFLAHDEEYAVTCPNCEYPDVLSAETCYPGALCLSCRGRLVGHFTCVICKVRTNYEDGGAGEDLISVACSNCVVRGWESMEATARAITRGAA